MSNNKAILFDMDGTLVNNMLYHKDAWEIFLKRIGSSYTIDEFTVHFGKTNMDLLSIALKRQVSIEEEKVWAAEKEALYRDIYADHITPVEGLIPLLDNLLSHNFKLAVGTSAPKENVDFVIEKCGLEKYFSTIVDDGQVEKGKPAPDIYLKAAAELGVEPKDCLVFEDSQTGINAALAAKMKVVALTTTHPQGELKGCEKIIKDYNEIDIESILNII